MILSEDHLPAALRALSTDEPAQPGDRLPQVITRVRRLRRRRAAAAATVTAVATVLAVVPVAVLGEQERPSPPAGDAGADPWPVGAQTPLASWPDRSRPADLQRAEGAYREFSASVARAQPPDGVQEVWGASPPQVAWLFRGTVEVAPAEQQYVAVFMTPAGSTRWLVVATADLDDVDEDGNALADVRNSPWTFGGWVPLPEDRSPTALGLYLNGSDAGTALFVLGDPLARTLQYRTEVLPGAERALRPDQLALPSGRQSSSDGVFSVAEETPTGEVMISLADAQDRRSAEQPLGTTTEPLMPPPLAPDVPDGFRLVDSSSFTSNSRYAGPRTLPEVSPEQVAAPVSVYVRCYGGGQLTVVLLGRTAQPACDGDTHRVLSGTRLPTASRSDWDMQLSSTRHQRYHVLIGSSPQR